MNELKIVNSMQNLRLYVTSMHADFASEYRNFKFDARDSILKQ